MKKLLTSIAVITIGILTIFGQGANIVGPTTQLVWRANPPEDFVTNYTVYTVSGSTLVKRITTTSTNVALGSLGIGNGPQAFTVTASNINGENSPGTNVMAIYIGNKPSAVTNLTLIK